MKLEPWSRWSPGPVQWFALGLLDAAVNIYFVVWIVCALVTLLPVAVLILLRRALEQIG